MDVSALLPGLSITRQIQHAAGLTHTHDLQGCIIPSRLEEVPEVCRAMPRRPMLLPHLSEEALRLNYRQCKDSADRTRWQALWLLAQGPGAKTQREVGQLLDRSHTWVGRLVRRYNATLTDPRQFPPKNEREPRRVVRPLL